MTTSFAAVSKFGGPSIDSEHLMLQRDPENGELFHLICTMRSSLAMTRLALNRNARARRSKNRLARPLWAGKSSANSTASARGQQGAAAQVLFARILGRADSILATFHDSALQSLLPCALDPRYAASQLFSRSCVRDCQRYRVCGKPRV